eukprot:TRINITY_DN4231_c0_g1_i3.p2 TRINITY_DN4231_c0_g1~~TRINITY_DN4231_c0_g1_i3.p2  ORF type:complete len:130 (-),score=20.23 TRINITY_DN4231_c0_g1_i3:509-898(-)
MRRHDEDEDETETSDHPLRPLFSSPGGHGRERINYPREWEELMMPDKCDIIKEHLKFGWRKAVFYLYLILLLMHIHQFPEKLRSAFVWVWVAQCVWFELDVTSEKNNYLISNADVMSECSFCCIHALPC